MLFKSGFWLSRNVLRQDPLGKILKRLNIATLDHGLIRIDIQPYIAENYRVLGALEKIQINQAFCKHRKLVLRTNVNLYAVLGLQQSQRLFSANKQSNPA
jgi:hypothetical protein